MYEKALSSPLGHLVGSVDEIDLTKQDRALHERSVKALKGNLGQGSVKPQLFQISVKKRQEFMVFND